MTSRRLKGALVSYAVLAAIGFAVLEGQFLGVILVVFGGLAVKSWIGYQRERIDAAEQPPENSPPDEADRH